jgi:hypothetical protein
MHDPGPAARARLRMAAAALCLALASCTDALSPRQHDREGTVVQLSQATRAELVSPAPGTLELRFVTEAGGERVQSFQGEIRFRASRHRVVSATVENGASATWHAVEPGRIRFAGVATEGITGRGIVFRFEESESFRATDFQLAVEEAILRADVKSAAVVRYSAAGPGGTPAGASASASASASAGAPAGAPAAQVAWEMRGDVNGDGRMDTVDALAVLAHVVGRGLPATFAVQPQGDVSRDGAVTAADALLILEYRVGRDRVVDVRITSSAGPVDVADSLVLSVELRGVRGDLRSDPVQWSCPDGARECGPRMYRPAIVALPSPAAVRLVASSGGLADTLVATVVEQPVPILQVDLSPHAALVRTDLPLSQDSQAIRAIPGGTTVVLATAQLPGSLIRRRIPRVSVNDTTVFSARVGELQDGGGTTVLVTGRRPGAGILTLSVNGATLPVRVDVAAPAALVCAPSTSLSLDLAPGEVRTFRGSDPGAPSCLDFRADRDRGRQYMVLMHFFPYSTGRAPNEALNLFGLNGQALFYGPGEATPAFFPVLRVFTPDVRPASLAVSSPGGPAAARHRENARHLWRVGGRTLQEGAPRRERAVHQVRPGSGARGGTGGARLNQSGTPLIAVGDTLVSGIFARLDYGVRTADGGPASDRAVVTYVGTALVLAEHLDVLRGRLIDGDGRVAAPIPQAEHSKLDQAYARPKRQLDRLFGGPYTGTVAGRNGGGRDLAVNMPLRTLVWGYAYADLTTINYWTDPTGIQPIGQPGFPQTPLVVAEELLAHEFTHVRHFQQWTDRDQEVGPWLVEGFADMGPQLAHAARVLGSETPSRTGRASTVGTNPSALPPMSLGSTSSIFAGYDQSSFIFTYLADQVEAGGGDALRAVRDLALAGHSRVASEAAVRRHLPALSLTDVIARAEVARHLEFLRAPPCRGCGGVAPAALRISPDLPDHTRFLQFDLPPLGLPTAYQAGLWPVLRPGASFGTAFQLRAGGAWPLFIDGTDPVGDAQYLLDLSSERQVVFSVVRIR